jgi:hypothetical protein
MLSGVWLSMLIWRPDAIFGCCPIQTKDPGQGIHVTGRGLVGGRSGYDKFSMDWNKFHAHGGAA